MSVGWVVLVVMVTGFLAWAVRKGIWYIFEMKSLNKKMMKFPYRTPVNLLLGHLPQLGSAEGYLKFSCEEMLKHGRAFAVWFGTNPALFVCHPDTIKQVIKNTEAKPTSSVNEGYSLVKPWIGDGLLIASGEKWVRNRRLLTPAFHFDILRPYIKVYQEAAAKCANNFMMLSEKEDDRCIEISQPLGLCTLDVMLTCALSFKTDVQEKGHPYEKAVARLMELILERAMNPLYLLSFFWRISKAGKEFQALCDYAHQVSGNIIKSRQESLTKETTTTKPHKKHLLDFLDILLTAKDEHGVGLTFQEIRDEVDTFLFEGHDTTKAGLSWAIYCLAKYPEEQKKVSTEILQLFQRKEELEWEDIQQLSYTSLFLKEVFRMYPPAPQMSRMCTRPFSLDGVEFPVGVKFEVHLYAMHHNPLIWENPETFNPDRFSLDNFANHDPYSYVPFSAGSRNCIGQVFALNEIKTVLGCLVRWFEFGFDADHEKNIILQPLGTLKSKNGVKVKVWPRNMV